MLQNETRILNSSSSSTDMSTSLEKSLISSSSPWLSSNPLGERYDMKEEINEHQEPTQRQSLEYPNETFQNETEDDDICTSKHIIRMITLPPRDLVPGSTKEMPDKERILHTHRRWNDDNDDETGNDKTGLIKWVRRRISSFESSARRQIYNVRLHGGIVGVA